MSHEGRASVASISTTSMKAAEGSDDVRAAGTLRTARFIPKARLVDVQETQRKDCGICEGEGTLPTFSKAGAPYRTITCPECGGSGHAA